MSLEISKERRDFAETDESGEWRTKDVSERIQTKNTWPAKAVEDLVKLENFPFDKATNVDWRGQWIVISPIDATPKYSENYGPCIGLVMVGKSKDGSGNISFLTHHKPETFWHDAYSPSRELKAALLDFSQKVEKGTVDAALFCGSVYGSNKSQHFNSIESIGKVIRDILGFDPIVVADPTYDSYEVKHCAFNTETRELLPIGTYEGPLTHEPFPASKVRLQKRFKTKDV